MLRLDPRFQIYVAEKTTANLIVAAHRNPHPRLQGIRGREIRKPFFNNLLGARYGVSAELSRGFMLADLIVTAF